MWGPPSVSACSSSCVRMRGFGCIMYDVHMMHSVLAGPSNRGQILRVAGQVKVTYMRAFPPTGPPSVSAGSSSCAVEGASLTFCQGKLRSRTVRGPIGCFRAGEGCEYTDDMIMGGRSFHLETLIILPAGMRSMGITGRP